MSAGLVFLGWGIFILLFAGFVALLEWRSRVARRKDMEQ